MGEEGIGMVFCDMWIQYPFSREGKDISQDGDLMQGRISYGSILLGKADFYRDVILPKFG